MIQVGTGLYRMGTLARVIKTTRLGPSELPLILYRVFRVELGWSLASAIPILWRASQTHEDRLAVRGRGP